MPVFEIDNIDDPRLDEYRDIRDRDRIVRIPMTPGVDSLNVGVAAAVCLHRFSTGRRT